MGFQLHAGSPGGECYPSGLTLEQVFAVDDLAAGIYLADLYCQRGVRVCELIDTDRTDVDCSGAIDEDEDLTDEDRDRLNHMCAIEWTERVFSMSAKVGRDSLHLTYDEDKRSWYGALGAHGAIWHVDRFQVMARLAALAYPKTETQVVA